MGADDATPMPTKSFREVINNLTLSHFIYIFCLQASDDDSYISDVSDSVSIDNGYSNERGSERHDSGIPLVCVCVCVCLFVCMSIFMTSITICMSEQMSIQFPMYIHFKTSTSTPSLSPSRLRRK